MITKKKIKSIDILLFSFVCIMLMAFIYPNFHITGKKANDFSSYRDLPIEKSVLKYKAINNEYPTEIQPQVGKPQKIILEKLIPNYLSESNYLEIKNSTYMIDENGRIYLLPDKDAVLSNVNLKQNGKKAMITWDEVERAKGYIVKEIDNKKSKVFNFEISVDILQGKIDKQVGEITIIDDKAENFVGYGTGVIKVIVDRYEPDVNYLVYAVDSNNMITPAIMAQ